MLRSARIRVAYAGVGVVRAGRPADVDAVVVREVNVAEGCLDKVGAASAEDAVAVVAALHREHEQAEEGANIRSNRGREEGGRGRTQKRAASELEWLIAGSLCTSSLSHQIFG